MYFFLYFQCTFQRKVPNKYTLSVLIFTIIRILCTYLVLLSTTGVLILYLSQTYIFVGIIGILILYLFWIWHISGVLILYLFWTYIFQHQWVYLFSTYFGLRTSQVYLFCTYHGLIFFSISGCTYLVLILDLANKHHWGVLILYFILLA